MFKFPTKKYMISRIIASAMVFFAVITMMCVGFFAVFSRTTVNGPSMMPTINAEYPLGKRDKIYINKLAKIKVNDIIVLNLSNYKEYRGYVIKRLVAVEGDIVNMEFDNVKRTYNLIVNGRIITSKPYQDGAYYTYNAFVKYRAQHEQDSSRVLKDNGIIKGIIVKKGEVFVLGDNWDASMDSSSSGPFKKKDVVGRVDIIVKANQNEFLAVLKRIF